MKVTPNQRVRIGHDTYEADTEYDLDRDLGVYIVRSGWGTSPEYKAPTGDLPADTEHDIKAHSTSHSVTSTEA